MIFCVCMYRCGEVMSKIVTLLLSHKKQRLLFLTAFICNNIWILIYFQHLFNIFFNLFTPLFLSYYLFIISIILSLLFLSLKVSNCTGPWGVQFLFLFYLSLHVQVWTVNPILISLNKWKINKWPKKMKNK